MNKEFKKLLEQSYTKGFEECARTGHKVGDLDVIFNSIVMGEFAELIVRECAEQIVAKGTDWIDFAPSQTGVRPEYWAMAQHIKQHFGV